MYIFLNNKSDLFCRVLLQGDVYLMVNVVFDKDGKYDDTATKTRIGEVALGIENKIAVGVLS